ncbi:MAG: hypothetical protein GKR87_09235 [Kiritimatiellae bacterium]|nr:hypothetical protein [Kiritimatiellia bacterium]
MSSINGIPVLGPVLTVAAFTEFAQPMPLGTDVLVNGNKRATFIPPAINIHIDNLSSGTYTVGVQIISAGYFPHEDPDIPGQVQSITHE